MADIDGKAVPPPYMCNWCAERLHERYGRAIYKDYKGRVFCSVYCMDMLNDGEKNDKRDA